MAIEGRILRTGHKIRVGFFLPHLRSGGIERVVVNLLHNLDRQRFSPLLLLATREGDLLGHVPDDVAVHDLRGRAMRFLPLRLASLLAVSKCDVVYSGTNAANLVILTASRMMRKSPAVIVSEHTSASQYLQKSKWRAPRLAAMRLLYPTARSVAVPLPEIGQELKTVLGRPGLATRVLLNPVVDMRMLAAGQERSPRREAGARSPLFVAAGRLHPVKGFDVLIDAFSRVARSIPASRLIILGEGPDRAKLEEAIGVAGLSDRVELPGFVADPMSVFRDADAFVLSSRREGCPNVVVEAMASGTPVIAANCGPGMNRLLEDGGAGILVPPEDPSCLARAMEQLVFDADLNDRFARSGLLRAADFEVSAATARFECEFVEAAGDRPHPSRQRFQGWLGRAMRDRAGNHTR